ncbi:MAG: low-specificity L-threonine aldolase [Gammaproteobacteria bacterium]|nr:low-specificity L-threonine aldolase [Gammaproteobacteria bacterium]
MRRAMAAAEVGDDVYDEDPTVKSLEAKLAEMAGQEAALFFPSGTQSNLAALLSHCRRGDEYIAAQNAHTYRYEAGGAAVLGGIQPQPLDAEEDGTLDLKKVAAAVKADDFHFARTRLLALENTTGGKVLPLEYLSRAHELARARNLGFHLDGARAFNAAVALGVQLSEITARFDSVSICLSKGLGAPVGSVLCARRELISRARRWRKMTGGGMRQVGVLAAAGLFALEHNIARLADDHARAQQLAEKLMQIDELEVRGAHTNMVFITLRDGDYDAFREHARKNGLRFGERVAPGVARLVVHKGIDDRAIEDAARILGGFFAEHSGASEREKLRATNSPRAARAR